MLRIIIVDDELPTLHHLKNMLDKIENVEVVGAFSLPSEAIKNIKKLNVDVAFLDIEMPGMNGITLAHRLIEEDKHLHIVFITAYSQYALEAFKVNALNYILKPTERQELIETLHRVTRFMGKDKNEDRSEKIVMDKVFIRCFGSFEIKNASNCVVKLPTQKTTELFVYFLIHRNKKIDKWRIIEAVFPECSRDKSNYNFHTSLYRLRHTLTKEGIPIEILSEKGSKDGYYCKVGNVECDLIELEQWFDESMVVSNETINIIETTLNQLSGNLLADKSYLWGQPFQEYYRRGLLTVYLDVANYYVSENYSVKALEILKNYYKLDPHEEKILQKMMMIYANQGDFEAVVKEYRLFEKKIKDDLDLELEYKTKQLFANVYVEDVKRDIDRGTKKNIRSNFKMKIAKNAKTIDT